MIFQVRQWTLQQADDSMIHPQHKAGGPSLGWPEDRSAFTQPFVQWEVQATGPRLLDLTIVMLKWSDYPIFNQSIILKMTTITLILDRQRCTAPIFKLVLIFKRWIKREEGGSGLWRHWMHNPLPSCPRPQFGLSHHYRHRLNCPHVCWRMRGRTCLWM